MQAERTALIQQVVKAVEALQPNEAIYLPQSAIVARHPNGTLKFANGWISPIWRRVDGMQGVREHTEMLLTGNPYHVATDRRELVFALKEGPIPVENVGRRGFHVVRPENRKRPPSLVDPSPHLDDVISRALREAQVHG